MKVIFDSRESILKCRPLTVYTRDYSFEFFTSVGFLFNLYIFEFKDQQWYEFLKNCAFLVKKNNKEWVHNVWIYSITLYFL